MLLRPVFRTKKEYGECSCDVAFWRPYVEEVCRRHRFSPCAAIRSGMPGTHPVFLVDDRRVVKFFSDRFSGAESFRVETEVYRLLQSVPEFPAPRLLAAGDLFPPGDGWHWPYLVSSVLPGRSLTEVWDRVCPDDREEIARYVGCWLRTLHAIPLAGEGPLSADWAPFVQVLRQQRAACVERHRAWNDLPAHLITQIDGYLLPVEALVDPAWPPVLVHADLNADHLLGEFYEGHWIPAGIIDFGDARAGHFLYELPALHLGLFHADRRLLQVFMEAYGPPPCGHSDFPRRAMCYALLFEFGLGSLFQCRPELTTLATLEEVAEAVWG